MRATLARRTARTAAATPAVAVAAMTSSACATPASTLPSDPTPNECSQQQIDQDAPVISRADVFIAAPPSAVWKVHTDINNWPTWKADVPSVQRLDTGPFRVGSSFSRFNSGLNITSTVKAVQQDRCTLWTGPAKAKVIWTRD